MAIVCTHCSRTNCADARYCYHDGASLLGGDNPALTARKTFLAPFVFGPGELCKDFDEFALGCQRHWDEAVRMLQLGFFQHFFNGLGRMDLAQAAQEAANFPDRDRGLDQFLARLPTKGLPAAKLDATPKQVDLGTLQVGQDTQFELTLENRGARLIFGSIASTCNWLTATETGEPRVVQFRDKATITVQVKGQYLRAGARPSEAELFIESNAGTMKVKVVVNVLIAAFPGGCMAGARSPRDLADKARHSPQEAAPLFAGGAVARWYAANGWNYPVRGTAPDGMAALEQFFEALGLSRPPKVFVNQPRLVLKGTPGTKLVQQIVVRSQENRAVHAHAKSTTSWCVVKPGLAEGNVVTLPVEIVVPAKVGETATALIRVMANGDQRFDIPVTVTAEATAIVPPTATIAPPLPSVGQAPVGQTPVGQAPVGQTPVACAPGSPKYLVHLAPMVLLVLVAVGLIAIDVWSDEALPQHVAVKDETTQGQTKTPLKDTDYKVAFKDEPDEGEPVAVRSEVKDEKEERFAAAPLPPVTVDIKNEPEENAGHVRAVPIAANALVSYTTTNPPRYFGISGAGKKLTYSAKGETNTTVVSVNGKTAQLGGNAGIWTRTNKALDNVAATPDAAQGTHSIWTYGALAFHQVLEVVPGQPTLVNGVMRRQRDTVLVRWILHNTDKRSHNAGLRMELDTLIGGNDGVPFTVPGRSGLVDTYADFREAKDVPDFIQALEYRNLKNPGTIAHLTLKAGNGIEPPGRVSLTRWSGASSGILDFGGSGASLDWNIPVRSLGSDSSVVLYWPEQSIKAGEKRTIGFAYGLGAIASNDKLGITLGGQFEPGQNFTVTAYVENPIAGQTLRLELPDGLKRSDGAEMQKVAAGSKTSIVTWKVLVERTGEFKLKVVSSTGLSQAKTITIARSDAPTGGKFAFDVPAVIELNKDFDIVAKTTDPVADQTLTLKLPAGVEKIAGADTQPASATARWQLRIAEPGKYPLRLASSTGIAQTKTITLVQPTRAEGAFQILLTAPFAPGKAFTVSTKVGNPLPDQKLTLVLPAGLERVEGDETQAAEAGALAWKVKVEQPGKFTVGVKSSTGVTQRKTVIIEPPSELPGRFSFEFVGDIRPDKEFQVKAMVANPASGQALTLKLPAELQLTGGEETQSVPAEPGATLTWTVRVTASGVLPISIESSTGLKRTKTITLTKSDLFGR